MKLNLEKTCNCVAIVGVVLFALGAFLQSTLIVAAGILVCVLFLLLGAKT